MRILQAVVALWLALATSVIADDAQPKTALFTVHPIATELQRLRLARNENEAPRLRAYVAISSNELIDGEGALQPNAIPTVEIAKLLKTYADRNNGIVTINMQFGNDADGELRTPANAADKQLQLNVENMGRAAGFSAALVSSTYGGPVLEKKLGAALDKVKGKLDEAEMPSGDELVTVYPVRTILSLLLTENSDCVVVIRTPLEKDGDNLLSPAVRDAVLQHVAAVKLRDKSKLQLSVKTRGKAISNDRINKFIGGELADLARTLGFASSSLQRSFAN